jgi:antirestriction protein ArdC
MITPGAFYSPAPEAWLKVLKEDKRAIFTAASHAQKAADYLHSLQT